ncbi:MAG: hypothetical protein JSS27_05085 [Planctomycetes bacterium]|nr:hypothetical protein [Planctomycetota bacterium]
MTIRTLVAVIGIGLLASTVSVRAADEKPAAASAEKGDKKQRVDPRGPLPDHYRDLVDGLQREQAYKIQESYRPKIAELEARLKELIEKRDGEIEALLRPEQKERLKQLLAEAKAKRKAARKMADAPKDSDAK